MSNYEWDNDPRSYALDQVEHGLVSAEQMLLCALKWMSHDEVRDMLDANELSPRFLQDDEPQEQESEWTSLDEGRSDSAGESYAERNR